MYIKQIITRNIQNHAEVVLDLPATGLIVLTGDNSNGKSVVVKVTRALVMNELKKPRKRASLVNRKCTFGEAIYTRDDDTVLTVHIAREASGTYLSLAKPGEEPVVRYLADKTYMDLVRTFGLHVAGESGITLNIAEADEALLFYKTPYKTNYEVIQIATSDSKANAAAEQLSNTLQEARNFRDQCAASARAIQPALQDLKIYDVEVLRAKREKMFRYYKILSKLYFPTLPEIHAVPKVRFVAVHTPQLPKIKWPKVRSVSCTIPDILPIARELKAVKEGKCPTCGRGFDCGCTDSIHN